jgi:hypothetical protein
MKEKLFYIAFMDNKANIGISHIIEERNSYEKERNIDLLGKIEEFV